MVKLAFETDQSASDVVVYGMEFGADLLDCVRAFHISVPILLRFLTFSLRGRISSHSCRSFHVRQSCWPPDCDVQPLQLVRTWKRGNNINPRLSDLFHSVLIPVPFRPLRCDSLQVNCGSHPAKMSRKAVSNSVVDPCSPRTSLRSQCVVFSFVFEHAALAYLGFFSLES